MNKCPICELEVNYQYFAFPKLPSRCQFSSIYGLVHLACLLSHPLKVEIQKELTKVYLQIFKNHPNFPIVAQLDYVLIKSRPDHEILEVYDFEDFVEFYVPFNQLEQVLAMNADQKIILGINKWTTLIADHKHQLTITRKFPKDNTLDILKLSCLNLGKLKNLLFQASSRI